MVVARFNGPALAAARERRGLTRRDVAQALSLPVVDRIRIWEDGVEQPRPAMIPQLAKILSSPGAVVSPLDLLTGVGEPPCLSALRLAAGLTAADVVEASQTLTKMTYLRLDSGNGPRRDPPDALVEELVTVLGVEASSVVSAIRQARALTRSTTEPPADPSMGTDQVDPSLSTEAAEQNER